MQSGIIQSKYCPLCNKSADPMMGKLSGYWYCKNCALGWIKIIPKTSYEAEYYTSGSSLLSKLFAPIEYLFYKIREYYGGFSEKKLWIDVGAGDGNFLEKVQAKKKIGVEVSLSGRKTMKNKGLTTMTNKEFLKAKNLKADIISFWQVLEHVTRPWEYIQAAAKNIKISGKIIIAVPNNESFELRFFGKYWFHLAPQYHIWHFSPYALKKMLENENLVINHIDYWAIEHHLTGILQSYINYSTHTEDILHKLVKRRQNLGSLTAGQHLWILFWCTLGLPLVIGTWIIAALFRKPGTFVIKVSKIR